MKFLELPMVTYQWPDKIYELAEKTGVDPDKIAERDELTPNLVISNSAWRVDLVSEIVMVTEDPKNPKHSIIDFDDFPVATIALPMRKLHKKITKFLEENGIEEDFREHGDPKSSPESAGQTEN